MVALFKERIANDIKMIIKNSLTTANRKLNYEVARNMALEEASKTYLSDQNIRKEVVALLSDPKLKLYKKIRCV